ncbi:MAG: cobalamin biosynthesis protein CbiX [Aromatoleum sp.]|nr:cobalamin biosynthesis protein CbiX [Aromatoleum sp.]
MVSAQRYIGRAANALTDAEHRQIRNPEFSDRARDTRRAEPFLRIAERGRAAAPDHTVEFAYLESMRPDLKAGVQRLAVRGVTRIRAVPLFVGGGQYFRRDIPELIRNAIDPIPDLDIELAEPAGADCGVVAAIAAYSLKRS